jgi:hypothetical protein
MTQEQLNERIGTIVRDLSSPFGIKSQLNKEIRSLLEDFSDEVIGEGDPDDVDGVTMIHEELREDQRARAKELLWKK